MQKNEIDAGKIAKELVELNAQRKSMTADGVELAKQIVDEGTAGEKVLVIYLPGVHESLAGIIAGRIRESYHKPVFVLTDGEEGVKGSGRSTEAYSMYDEMCKCRECFSKFGGHPMAAGLSLCEDVAVFRGKINACCELTEEDFIPKIRIDMAMPAAYPTIGLIRELARLEPFGNGNSKPQFADRELALLRASVVGRNQNVLKLSLMTAAGEHVSAVYFGDVEAWKQYYSEKYGQTEVDAALRGRANAIRMSVISGKREKALLEEELAALRETEKRERELLHKIAGQKDTAEEQFARMTASRAQMEKEIEEIEQQMQQNGELSENGAQAAGELHNTLITMNNGIATFDANHSVFMEQVKGQNEKVVEIVENNKHFTTPMKHISEAPQALREMRQALGERAERMEELSKTMGVLALNSAIEAGRMGESGTRFVTAAEQVRAYADDYEQEALALKDQLGEAEERIASLEEQVHHLNELLKENNISMGKLYRDCAQNMAAYETGQIGLRGLIQDTAVARADVLQQSADENVRAREAFLKYVSGMQEELAEQKSSADELENVCKSILQSAGEAG